MEAGDTESNKDKAHNERERGDSTVNTNVYSVGEREGVVESEPCVCLEGWGVTEPSMLSMACDEPSNL
jgi:hypothetical protein